MLTTKRGIQLSAVASAITFLSISATALATSPSNCVEVTATNQQHMETGLAEQCSYFYVCSTGDQEVLGYYYGSSSVETTLYTGESNLGYKTQPQECIIQDPGSCDSTEQTLASLIDNGLAETCNTFYVCTTGDNANLGYSWLSSTTTAEVFTGSDGLGYAEDPKNCALIEEVDLAINISGSTTSITENELAYFNISVQNIGTIDSTETATINSAVELIDGCSETACVDSGSLTIVNASSDSATCDSDAQNISCSTDAIAAGETINIQVVANADRAGYVGLSAQVDTADDANPTNNSANLDIDIDELDTRVKYEDTAISILSAAELPHSENGTFTDSGRLFVASTDYGESIYEITKNSDGSYNSIPAVQGPENCRYTGLTSSGNTLYAACQTSSSDTFLTQIKVSEDGLSTISKKLPNNPALANGMAVGPDGSIYISDSQNAYSMTKSAPIFKVTITNDETFEFTVEDWLGTEHIIKFPNGVQIEGNTIYFADHYKVRTIEIDENGNPGAIDDFYTTTSANLIDDLTITPDYIAISEIKYPTSANGSNTTGHTILIDKESGETVKQIAADKIYEPSSIIYDRDGVFGEESLFVTDYFKSGLYEIKAETELPL